MKNIVKSNVFTWILAIVLTLALLVPTLSIAAEEVKAYAGTTLTMMMPEHPNQPMSGDKPIIQWILDATGIKLDLEVVPSSDYNTKASTLIATNSFPDILRGTGGADVFKTFLDQGLFVNVLEYPELIQNYQKVLEKMPEVKQSVFSINGSLYGFPNLMYYENKTGPLPMIRGDILEETGLGMPTTINELADVLIKMKELYPNQYIWASRGTPLHPSYALGAGWQWGSSSGVYFDHDRNKWVHGPTDENWITYLEFMQRLAIAGVLDPEYGSAAIWQEKESTGLAFFAWDNAGIPINWNIALQQAKPGAGFIPIPTMTNQLGQKRGLFFNNNGASVNTVIRQDSPDQSKQAAVWLIDWLLSEDGRVLSNFGIEGETYNVIDGVPRFTDELIEKAKTMSDPFNGVNGEYGLGSLSLALYVDQRAQWPFMSETVMEWYDIWANDDGMNQYYSYPPYTPEENEELADLIQIVNTMFGSRIEDFIYAKASIDEYKNFQEQLKDAGATRIEEIINNAYQRFLTNQR